MKHIVYSWIWALFGVWVMGSSAPVMAQQTKPAAPATTAPRTPNGRLSPEPAQYILDVQAMMASTNNAAAKATAASLQQLWATNKLTATHQASIVATSQQMLAKKYRPRPHFDSFFQAILAGANGQLSDTQMTELLSVIAKAVEKEELATTEKFLASAAQFLNTKTLYTSRYNNLRVLGGNFSFAYNENDNPLPAPPRAPKPVVPAPVVAKTEPVAAPAAASKPAAKPKPKSAPKKKSSDGWDTADLWDSGSDNGWGSDDGWGTPKKAPAKKAPVKTSTAKTPAKAAAPVVKEPEPEPAPAFDAYDTYAAPPTRGPVLIIKDADLLMATAGDSVVLRKTSGLVVPGSSRFVGQGGQMAWTVNNSPVTADLGGYDFDIAKAEFTADPVTLTYAAVLEAPIEGAFAYKSVKKKPGAVDSGYPRFISLTNDARVKNLGDNIRYVGGFSLAGSKMLSASLDGSLSRITVEADGKTKFAASSRAYVLGDSLLTAARAAVTIYQDKADSLTHPGVKLKYNKRDQVLQLNREEGLYKTTPYYDSYHQMEIATELLTWPIRTPVINFAMLTAKNQATANFESKEFYTNTRYQQIKAINKLHPLQMVVGYSQAHGDVKTFTVKQMATDLKVKEANVRSAVSGLARDGYVVWKAETDEVTLLPKASHYVRSSRGKKDYDHIAIKSLAPSGKNATLDLNSNDLIVRGVDRFNFSDDSITVYVKPDSSTIRIQKNRGVLFNGTVVASAFIFKGKEFKFDYDGFFIDLVKIDSIIVKGKNSKGSVMKTRKDTDFALTNKNKRSSGKLYINDPKNKSGRKKLGAYPSFDASTGAYVYFNKPEVLGGAYDTAVYFDIPPFRLDSLNNKNRSAVGFKGTFMSGGILPPIKTKLSLQEDGSLGFNYDAPKEGLPVYGGKGRLFNKVQMSNRGIQGNGELTYLTGKLQSEQFIFYQDSVVTAGKAGTIAQGPLNGVNYANVGLLPGYEMKWVVKADSMYITTPRDGMAMKFYGSGYSFKGTTILTPGGLYGNGRMDGPESFIRSPQFVFLPTSYKGKKSTLSIKSSEVNKPALTANEVSFDYDIKQAYANFTREEGSKASIDLPYSDFKTTLSGGRWDFKKKYVQMRVAPGADSTQAYFYSTKEEQKGLKFKGTTGQYDLSRYRLVAGGVPYIAAADAWIMPDSSKVYVLANAQMRSFQNAGIVMDTLTKYHALYKGEIEVKSRTSFTGTALYSYQNATADSFAIKFANFAVDSVSARGSLANTGKSGVKGLLGGKKNNILAPLTPATVAVANIQAADKFRLGPRIPYRGNVRLNSQRRGFIFDGQARLDFTANSAASGWFAVQDSIDPKDMRIKFRDLTTEDGTPMLTGLFLSGSTAKVYPLFAAPKPDVTDLNVFKVDGTIRFDAKKRNFTIARHDADDINSYEGQVLKLDDSTGIMDFRGKMELIASNKDYSLTAAGVGKAMPDSNRYELDTFLAFDINMPDKAIEAMAADLANNIKGAPEALTGSQNELYKLGEFIGSKAVQGYAARKGSYVPLQKLSSQFLHTLVLSKVNLVWSEKKKAWYSVGKIGLTSVGKKDLNALIDGYVEIKRESSGDAVEIYLEAEPRTWYYIKYTNNVVLAKAQHGSFDEIISLKAKGDYNTATQYGFYLGDDQEVQLFLDHFRKDYLGEDLKKRKTAPVVSGNDDTGNFDNMEDTGKKKKKKKQEAVVDEGTTPAPADAPVEEPSRKKKKKDEAVDQAAPPADAPVEAPKKEKEKKKKKKSDEEDPFGDS